MAKYKFINIQIMQTNIGDILHQQEIKEIIAKLQQIDIKDYCSTIWFKQDQNLQKLNMQLHVNAIMKNDEYILQQCVTQQKFKVLIYDLIMTNTWKSKILPLIKQNAEQLNSLKLYLAVYHEAVVCNILQVLMFHRTAIDQSGDFLIEIIDYCYRKIMNQIRKTIALKKAQKAAGKQNELSQEQKKTKRIQQILKRTPAEELDRQIEQIEFNLFIMSLSIIRYITDYIRHLEIGIVHHLIIQCNIYALLVPLIEDRPWLRTNDKGERELYDNNKWVIVTKNEVGRLPKIQAQVWITLYNLFMDPQCRKKYQLNDERKNTLLRLRKYMNQILLDQIPNLSAMLRSLQQLSIMTVPSQLTHNPFVVQQIPQILTAISQGINWKQLSENHKEKLKESVDETQRTHFQRLAELYSNNNVQGLVQGFKCAKCTKQAFKRCSKCKSVWYCTRQCQVADWPGHKTACNEKVKANQKFDEAKKASEENKEKEAKVKPVLIDELD